MIYRDANRVARCDGCDAIAVDEQRYLNPGCLPVPERTRVAYVRHFNGCRYKVDLRFL